MTNQGYATFVHHCTFSQLCVIRFQRALEVQVDDAPVVVTVNETVISYSVICEKQALWMEFNSRF